MNPNIEAEDLASTFIRIDANPLPLQLPIGSAVFVVRGEVWLTQDGCTEDFVLGAGRRFDARSGELIHAGASKSDAQLYVARPASRPPRSPRFPIICAVHAARFGLAQHRARAMSHGPARRR